MEGSDTVANATHPTLVVDYEGKFVVGDDGAEHWYFKFDNGYSASLLRSAETSTGAPSLGYEQGQWEGLIYVENPLMELLGAVGEPIFDFPELTPDGPDGQQMVAGYLNNVRANDFLTSVRQLPTRDDQERQPDFLEALFGQAWGEDAEDGEAK